MMRRNQFLALMAMFGFVAASTAPVHATPYASNVTITGGTTVSFTLNEPSPTLTYSINGGAPISLDGTAKGTKTFNLGAPTDTFSIVAEKTTAVGWTIPTGGTIPAAAAGGTSRPSMEGGLTVISDDTSTFTRYNSPRGIGINNNPNSPYFGTVYIGNSAAGSLAVSGTLPARSLGDGLYAVRSDGSDAFGYGDTAQNPNSTVDGFALFVASASSPYRITVGQDGNLYVADFADVNSNAFVVTPDLKGGANLFTGFSGPPGPGPVGGDGTGLPAGQYHGSLAAILPSSGSVSFTPDGNGGYNAFQTNNLEIYVIDEDMNSAHVSGVVTDPQNDRNSVWKHVIGNTNVPVNPVPTKASVVSGGGGLIGDFPAGGITVDFDRGPDGKFYLSQFRSAGAQPGLVVTDANGVKLWDSLQTSASITSTSGSVGVPGDYNGSGVADASDYVVYRKGLQPLANEVNDGTAADPVGCSPTTTPCTNNANGIGNTNANDYTAWRARYGNTNDVLTNLFQIQVSPDGKWLAGNLNGSDVVVIPLINGIPDLANRMVINSAATNVNSSRDIAFDAAGNIHYVSSGQGQYRVLSPGGHTKTTLTWNGTSYAFSSVTLPGSGSLGGGEVPEPSALALLALGSVIAAGYRKRHA